MVATRLYQLAAIGPNELEKEGPIFKNGLVLYTIANTRYGACSGADSLPPGSPFGNPSFQSLDFQSPVVKGPAAQLDNMGGVDGRLLSGDPPCLHLRQSCFTCALCMLDCMHHSVHVGQHFGVSLYACE